MEGVFLSSQYLDLFQMNQHKTLSSNKHLPRPNCPFDVNPHPYSLSSSVRTIEWAYYRNLCTSPQENFFIFIWFKALILVGTNTHPELNCFIWFNNYFTKVSSESPNWPPSPHPQEYNAPSFPKAKLCKEPLLIDSKLNPSNLWG